MSAPVLLTQQDFQSGTVRITQPGTYLLTENIVFNPNPAGSANGFGGHLESHDAGKPLPRQYGDPASGFYDPAAYGLGFFAAIAIECDDVIIDLNGFTLEQGLEHSLHQRFFGLITLNDQPFPPRLGPADFGTELQEPARIEIRNGTLGRTSHHGILGNNNQAITLSDLHFVDYEVAGISLNGVRNLSITNIDLRSNDHIFTIGTYSSVRFLLPYLEDLARKAPNYRLELVDRSPTAAALVQTLRSLVHDVHVDLIDHGRTRIDPDLHPQAFALFHNASGLIDGTSYGINIGASGLAIGGFGAHQENFARNLKLNGVRLEEQLGAVAEIPALFVQDKVITDPVGAVVQMFNQHPLDNDLLTISSEQPQLARYLGTPLSDAQLLLAKAVLDPSIQLASHLDVSRLNVPQALIDWAESGQSLQHLLDQGIRIAGGGDSMSHVNKGVIGIRIDGAEDVSMEDIVIESVINRGEPATPQALDQLTIHPLDTRLGYDGTTARGVSITNVHNLSINQLEIGTINSAYGAAIGVDWSSRDLEPPEINGLTVQTLLPGTALLTGETLPWPNRPAQSFPVVGLTSDPTATGPQLLLDSSTFGLHLAGGSNSPVEHWNSILSDQIADARLGPTLASRAYALLNTVFYDLLVATSGEGRPVYFDATLSHPTSLPALDDLLNQAAQHLLSDWFEGWENDPDRRSTPEKALIQQDALSWLGLQLDSVPELNPSELNSGGDRSDPLATDRLMEEWLPEHVPIDDPHAPLQQPLTPHWGDLEAFSFLNPVALRPDGPEPFLVLDADQARLDLPTGLLHLTDPVSLNSSTDEHDLVLNAGAYDLRDPSVAAQLIGPVINPDFIRQAQDVVDMQTQLSDDQKLIAEFWEDGSGSSFPPGTWMAITAYMAAQSELALADDIRLNFAVGQALGDAGIAAWDAKYHFNYARPVRVIRDLASLDLLEGNNLESWNPYQLPGSDPSPPFPEYVSGHSSFSTAAAGVLRTYFGSDQLDLAITVPAGGSRFEPGVTPVWPTTLSWPTLTLAAEDAGVSRLYGGIHFDDGNQDGLILGTAVSELVLSEAQNHAYDNLGPELTAPFLLANRAEVDTSSDILIDGSWLAGVTTLDLAAGDDTLFIHPGADLTGALRGGTGRDQLSFADWSEPVWVVMDSSQSPHSPLGEFSGFETVIGGSAADRLEGGQASMVFVGGEGSDTLIGHGTADVAVFPGLLADYQLDPMGLSAEHPGSNEVDRDRLTGIELLRFDDGEWSIADVFHRLATWLNIDLVSADAVKDQLTVRLQREGYLAKPLTITLAVSDDSAVLAKGSQPSLPRRTLTSASSTDALPTWTVTLPAQQTNLELELPLEWMDHWLGLETGFLQVSDVQIGTASNPNPSGAATQVFWSERLHPFQLAATDPSVASTAQQSLVPAPPLSYWIAKGQSINLPLAVNLSVAKNASPHISTWRDGLRISVEVPSQFSTQWEPDQMLLVSDQGLSRQWLESVGSSTRTTRMEWSDLVHSADSEEQPLGALHLTASAKATKDALTGINLTLHDLNDDHSVEQQLIPIEMMDWSLDVDGDGAVNPFTDGLLAMRYLLGFRGTALIDKTVNPTGRRQSVDQITHWLDQGLEGGWLDLDGNGEATAFGDGLMIMRGLLGISGSALMKGALSQDSPVWSHSLGDEAETEFASSLIMSRLDSLTFL